MGSVDNGTLQAPLLDEERGFQSRNPDNVALKTPTVASEENAVGRRAGLWTRAALVAVCCILAAAVLVTCFGNVQYRLTHVSNSQDESDTDEAVDDYLSASMTTFHFRPERHFMSDPNAPLVYKNYYHFFYQYNPLGSVWGNITWGHAVSKDLLNWKILDIILRPDRWYDYEGTWSGSATILKDGSPIILYTGGRGGFGAAAEQSQNMAYPVDPSDPFLRKWEKSEDNPILYNPDFVRPQDFRDPTTAWLEDDGIYRLAVGARKPNDDGKTDGIALIYTSTDFKNWHLEDTWLHRVYSTGMWECVDLFPITVNPKKGLDHSVLRAEHYYSEPFKYVLKVSLDDVRHDHYTIGTYSTETHTFTADDPVIDAGNGLRYDYGKFYASKTFLDGMTGRRILWGYCNESDTELDDVKKGWSSVQAIPRTLWLDPLTQKYLLQWPVEEVETLRKGKTSLRNVLLEPESLLPISGVVGSQLDILVSFEKPKLEGELEVVGLTLEPVEKPEFDCSRESASKGIYGPFGVLLHADDTLKEHTAIFYYITKTTDGRWATRVCSDQSRSSLAKGLDKTAYGNPLMVYEEEEELSLRILVDHSMVETFVQGGKVALTARVYPTIAINSRAKVFLFNNGSTPMQVKSFDAYKMGSVKLSTVAPGKDVTFD